MLQIKGLWQEWAASCERGGAAQRRLTVDSPDRVGAAAVHGDDAEEGRRIGEDGAWQTRGRIAWK